MNKLLTIFFVLFFCSATLVLSELPSVQIGGVGDTCSDLNPSFSAVINQTVLGGVTNFNYTITPNVTPINNIYINVTGGGGGSYFADTGINISGDNHISVNETWLDARIINVSPLTTGDGVWNNLIGGLMSWNETKGNNTYVNVNEHINWSLIDNSPNYILSSNEGDLNVNHSESCTALDVPYSADGNITYLDGKVIRTNFTNLNAQIIAQSPPPNMTGVAYNNKNEDWTTFNITASNFFGIINWSWIENEPNFMTVGDHIDWSLIDSAPTNLTQFTDDINYSAKNTNSSTYSTNSTYATTSGTALSYNETDPLSHHTGENLNITNYNITNNQGTITSGNVTCNIIYSPNGLSQLRLCN